MKRRALKKRYGAARPRRSSDRTFFLGPEWKWVSGKEYVNERTGVWAKEIRPGVGCRIHVRSR